MKKIIVTENQIRKIIDNMISEQSMVSPLNKNCDTKKLKDVNIDNVGFEKNYPSNAVRKALSTVKFKVLSIEGSAQFNGREFTGEDVASKSLIITPDTTITLCGTSNVTISGGGMNEAMIVLKNGLTFIPQFA